MERSRDPYRRSLKPRANEGDLVTIRTYGDALSAETDRASLEGAGIHAVVIEGMSFNPMLAAATGAVRLQVAAGDVEEANEVLGVASVEEAAADEEGRGVVRCPRCELAYCDFERPRMRNVPPTIGFLLLPAMYVFGEKRWRCQKCLHVWDDPREGPREITRLRDGDPRPIFRLRRSRAGFGTFLGVVAGVAVVIAWTSRATPLVIALTAFVGAMIGRVFKHEVCSVPDCRTPLPPVADAAEDVCPGCKGTVSGVVFQTSEHYAEAAAARRALAELHAADDARRARKRRRRQAQAGAPSDPGGPST